MRVAMTLEQCWHRVPGGTAVAAIEMARALHGRDDIDVIGVAARHDRPPDPAFAPPIEVAQLPLPRPLLYESWHRLRAPRVERATGRVDVIHATTSAIPPPSAPLVVTIHDLAFEADPSHFTRRGLRLFRRGLALARRDAALILCPSAATMRDCLAHGFDRDRVRVVPFGFDLTPATAAGIEQVRDRYHLTRRYILWTGTIEPRKNLARLLDAFRGLDSDVDLVLAGPRGWHEDVDALLDGLEGRVRALGFVARRDLDALYAGAAAFCFPSLLEGFGFPVLEAMAHGAPVVTSRGTSTEEVAGDATLLVDPYDPVAIRSALQRVLDDERLARELATKGRLQAGRFSWDRTAELLVSAYREVV